MTNTCFSILAVLLAAIPVTASAENLGGARAELNFGYDRLSSDEAFTELPETLDGARIGGALGYDVAVSPHVMVGIEADAGWTLGSARTVPLARDRLAQKLGRDLGVSLRVTVPVSSLTSVFAKAGYASSRVNVRYDAGLNGEYEAEHSHYDRSGLRLGAGIEQAISARLYAKAEYRWTRYGRDLPYLGETTRNQLLVGFGTRF